MKPFLSVCLVSSAACIALLLSGCPTTAAGPQADFTADVISGAAPLGVQFTDLSNPGVSAITQWEWLFGDGESSTQQHPAHTYVAAGTYNVSLKVTNAGGNDTALKLNYITAASGGEGEGEGETETILLPGNVPLTMTRIPAGPFLMGRYAGEQAGVANEDPQHAVTVPEFWIGKYEVTQAQWQAVAGINPSHFGGDNRPVDSVTWDDITNTFLPALNDATGRTFRLPSEAEWEYACRAGTTTRFYWGDDPSYSLLDQYAWYSVNSTAQTHDVGGKLPNAWGLYDMTGNVWEWVQDWYHPDYTGAPGDGSAWGLGTVSNHVLRGACWSNSDTLCRSASRTDYFPGSSNYYFGFRLVHN